MTSPQEYLLAITTAGTIEDVWALHVARMAEYGFDGLLYASTKFRSGHNLGDIDDAFVLSNQPEVFTKAYLQGGLYRDAPMVRWAMDNVGILSWSKIIGWAKTGQLSPGEEKVVAFNAQHNVRVGFGIAFRNATFRSGAGIGLSTSTLTQDEVDDLLAERGDELELANTVMHLAVSALPRRGLLTERQREALRLVAEGKSSKDAATVMEVSVSMVEKHLRDARERLNVDTTPQAVAKAAMQNQVLWYPDGTDNAPAPRM